MSKRRKHKTKPENVMEQWRKIPIERRTWYYNQVFPEGTTSQSRRRFIYGEEGMKEAEKFEKWLENQTTLPRKIAWKMYEQIGMFDKNISILSKTRYKKVFEINHKWRVVFYIKTKRFYWYDINGKSRDQRAEHFAEILKGHNNIAKIVEPIYSEEQAIKILKRS